MKFIHSYLNEGFVLNTTPSGFIGLFRKENNTELFHGVLLLKEFKQLFYLKEDEIKTIVQEWACKIIPDVSLEEYWKFKNLFLNGIMSSLISQELVSIQPMDGPRGELFYLDYVYSGTTAIH
jgi:hypothetical protein